MKRIFVVTVSIFFLLASATPGISKEYNRDTRGRPNYKAQSRKNYDRDRHEDRGRPGYHGYEGYRERPYNKHRKYSHSDYKGHRYVYKGHWRSWDQWDRYARRHPEIYKHGRYYRESGHLMFRFCTLDGGYIFFSIGR